MTDTGIECFLAVCRHKNGSKAAESLYITQSSLSVRLKTLERELGGALFVRSKGSREMVLTEAGERFYELAVQYETLVQQMKHVCRTHAQILRVSSLNSLDTYLLPQVYDRFLQTHTDIGLEIQDTELVHARQNILNGNTDLAFTTGNSTDAGLTQTLAFIEPMVLICGKDTAVTEPVTPVQLSPRDEVYVHWSRQFSQWHQQTFGDANPQIRISIMAHLKQFMERPQCWACVPVSVADGLQRECGVRRVETAFALPKREVSIVTHHDKAENEAILAFYQCLQDTVSAYPEIQITL